MKTSDRYEVITNPVYFLMTNEMFKKINELLTIVPPMLCKKIQVLRKRLMQRE